MARWMNGGEIEPPAMVANGECAQDTPKSRPVSAKSESANTVSFSALEGWLDRIQVGFPRANWW